MSFFFKDPLPSDCAGLQQAYTQAVANDDYVTAMEAASKITLLYDASCTVPGVNPPAGGFSCDMVYRIYTDQHGIFNQQAKANAYASLVANNCPQVVPSGSGPAPFDCAQVQQQYIQALQNGQDVGELYHQLITNGCTVPDSSSYCATYMSQFNSAYNAKDVTAMKAAIYKLVTSNCAMPGSSQWNQATDQPVYPSGPPTPPPRTPSPPPDNKCADLMNAFNMAKNQKSGPEMTLFVQQMCANSCPLPAGVTCPTPVPAANNCNTYMAAFNTAVENGDTAGVQAAINNMCLAGCTLPAGWICNSQGPGPATGGGTIISGGNTPSGGGMQPVPPPVNPCTGEQSLTLIDYLVTLPLKGLKDDPILAVVIGGVGVVGGLLTEAILIPEAGLYARVPASALGAYGGLIVNGILDNYDWIKNAQQYGIVFGSLVTGLGAVSGIYQSIHNSTEKFLKTELGGAVGEVVYKVGEGVISGGLFPVYDILFGDKTWTTAGYDKAKCEAGCDDPSLSSLQRKMCKLGARLDLKF